MHTSATQASQGTIDTQDTKFDASMPLVGSTRSLGKTSLVEPKEQQYACVESIRRRGGWCGVRPRLARGGMPACRVGVVVDPAVQGQPGLDTAAGDAWTVARCHQLGRSGGYRCPVGQRAAVLVRAAVRGH